MGPFIRECHHRYTTVPFKPLSGSMDDLFFSSLKSCLILNIFLHCFYGKKSAIHLKIANFSEGKFWISHLFLLYLCSI